MASRTGGVINDAQFDVDAEGRFELRFGGKPAPRNWLALEPGATRITTRHYYENERSAAADPTRNPAFEIEVIDATPVPPAPSDASVAAGSGAWRRSCAAARWVSRRGPERTAAVRVDQPNQFPKPMTPGAFGLAAFDAHYSMAPYLIGPDDALVMTGRWPKCRCANVSLWNRHMQTYDFANRQRVAQPRPDELERDGSFRMILAHRDPGLPNWLDTEGRPFGLVFWRFMLRGGRDRDAARRSGAVRKAVMDRVGEHFMLGFHGFAVPDWVREFEREFGLGGLILFDRDVARGGPRNIEGPEQVRALCAEIHALDSRPLVFIDQEGGKVRRLKPAAGFATCRARPTSRASRPRKQNGSARRASRR